MTTWIDPNLEEALVAADLVAVADVTDANPNGVAVRVVRVLAGRENVGTEVAIARAPVIGHGHALDTLSLERFLFIVRAADQGYVAFTDTYWWFRVGRDDRVHMPIRDPFTRSYPRLDDLAELTILVRDRTKSPDAFLGRQIAELAATPVAATEPIDSHTQVIALEVIALVGREEHANAALPFVGSPHYQMRWSAVRALDRCGGEEALRALLELLQREDVPPIQTAIGQALLGRVTRKDRAAIVAALPRMHDQELLLSRNIMNPAMNRLPAPRAVLQAVLEQIDCPPPAPPGVRP